MNKVAVVTGGSRGIGYAIARNMVRDGYVTCILGRRKEEQVREAMEALRAGGEVFYFSGSTACSEDRETFIREVVTRYGRIDVLVNNAGVAPKVRQDLLSTTEESFDYVMGVNVKGTMFMTQRAVREMLKQEVKENGIRAVIVNISSFSQFVSSPSRPEYCVSKAGVSMLTRLYADRLAGESIYDRRCAGKIRSAAGGKSVPDSSLGDAGGCGPGGIPPDRRRADLFHRPGAPRGRRLYEYPEPLKDGGTGRKGERPDATRAISLQNHG